MKEKKEKERERGKRSRAQRNGALNIARSRASHSFSVFIVDIIIAQSPLSLSRARPLSRRKENPLKRSNLYTHHTRTRTQKNTHLGGTNELSMPPPCDPGACAYMWSSKSKLCSCAGFIPDIRDDISFLSSLLNSLARDTLREIDIV